MTKEGWPVAQPKLRRRPSARTMTPWPSGKMKRSHWGLMFWRLMPGQLKTPAMSICKQAAAGVAVAVPLVPAATRGPKGALKKDRVMKEAMHAQTHWIFVCASLPHS